MDLNFSESGLQFSFDPLRWQIRKYDDHPYFQGFSGMGLKGVDFVALLDQETVLLIEVKNYKLQGQTIRKGKIEQSLSNPQLIVEAIAGKFEDTLAGIKAIHTYYQRKARRRWRWLERWQKPDQEEIFWKHICAQAIDKGEVQLVLWLEMDSTYQQANQYIKDQLPQQTELKDYRVLVLDESTHPYEDSLQVELMAII